MIALLPMLAGMGIDFVKDLIQNNGEDLVKEGIKKVTGIDLNKIKKLTPEDATKINAFKLDLEKLNFEELKLEIEARQKDEEEKTKRWESDNNSDSRIAKLTRPALVIYLIFAISVMALMDGNVGEFTIKEHWVSLFTTLAVTALGGYFTLRTYEKRTGSNGWKK